MTDEKLRLVQILVDAMPELTLGQLHWIHRVVEVFGTEYRFAVAESDLFDETVLRDFGDAMRIHHSFSDEPFSKDKFEYVLVKVLKISGRKATLAPRGNPGHDITVDGVKISLKTQADKTIKEHWLWVSKFMELGKGQWNDNPADLEGLRQQFFEHMKSYDRILSLRALEQGPHWKYELVEIPKKLLALARSGNLEMKVYSSNINISFFHSADEFEIVRQQRTQFALIFARISEEFLTSGFEFGERLVVSVIQGFLLEEFPEAFDQIQIRRIGREEYELDA